MKRLSTIIVTPPGTAIYPSVGQPTKWGRWKIEVKLTPEEARPLQNSLMEMWETFAARQEVLGETVQDDVRFPWDEVEGGVVFKFSAKATRKDAEGREVAAKRPAVVDAQKQPINTDEVWVCAGSTVKVKGTASPYNLAERSGISIRLEATQVLELGDPDARHLDSFDVEPGFMNEEALEEL